MIKMKQEEAKMELIKMFAFFDKVCRENDIKYSLIGGSLIGAIRHKGIIPWDDDIDIILDKNNYDKLIYVFENKEFDDTYKLVNYKNDKSFFFPFSKLMNTKTKVIEHNSHKKIENYGIFLDIFYYVNMPNEYKMQKKYFRSIKLINSLLSITDPKEKGINIMRRILRFSKNLIAKVIGDNRIHNIQEKNMNKYLNYSCDYIVSNWPVYDMNKEIQEKKNIKEYIDADFEGIKAMIFKNYDNILKNTFGDYMKLPPEDKRINHNMEVYWVGKI